MLATSPSTKWAWITAAVLALLVGTYPLAYLLTDMKSNGVLHGKSMETLNSAFYLPIFYIHIGFGGIALCTGWIQFSEKWRSNRLHLHRSLGKLYMLSVLFSSLAGFFISFFSYGGIITTLGFGLLALAWLFTDVKGYLAIRHLDITSHRRWMTRNYALAFAAVTLRIYLPVSTMLFSASFLSAYRVISWACWIPNLLFAEFLIRRLYPPITQPG